MTLTSSPERTAPTIPPWVNRLVVVLLHAPLHPLLSRTALVLTVTGRRSGRRYPIPVRYLRTRDQVLVTTDSSWWLNSRGGAPVTLRLQGREVAGQAEVRTDPEAVEQCLLAFLRQMPHDARFYQITRDQAGQPDPVSVKRAGKDRVLITISLGTPEG